MTANLAKALAAFQAEVPTVHKDQSANTGTYSYAYAGLPAVTGAVMPLLAKNGLAFSTLPTRKETGYYLVGMLLHESGESLTAEYPLPANAQPQQLGSAITYGRRYLLGCMTGVVTDDDDDGAAAQTAPRQRRRQPAQADQPETGEMITDKQLVLLGIAMREAGITDRDEGHARVAAIIGRDVASSKELTKREASKVIDAFKAGS